MGFHRISTGIHWSLPETLIPSMKSNTQDLVQVPWWLWVEPTDLQLLLRHTASKVPNCQVLSDTSARIVSAITSICIFLGVLICFNIIFKWLHAELGIMTFALDSIDILHFGEKKMDWEFQAKPSKPMRRAKDRKLPGDDMASKTWKNTWN